MKEKNDILAPRALIPPSFPFCFPPWPHHLWCLSEQSQRSAEVGVGWGRDMLVSILHFMDKDPESEGDCVLNSNSDPATCSIFLPPHWQRLLGPWCSCHPKKFMQKMSVRESSVGQFFPKQIDLFCDAKSMWMLPREGRTLWVSSFPRKCHNMEVTPITRQSELNIGGTQCWKVGPNRCLKGEMYFLKLGTHCACLFSLKNPALSTCFSWPWFVYWNH